LLSIRLLSSARLSLFLAALLIPGGAIAGWVVRSQASDSPLLVFVANAVVYAAAVFTVLSIFGRGIAAARLRAALHWLSVPVIILVGLVCVPAFNPLWPRHMNELATEEESLIGALRLGIGLDESRAVLRSRGIQFDETYEKSDGVLLRRDSKSIFATVGDRVISARVETGASQFPCGYDIEIVLLFGSDERMRDQYIRRRRLCP
jgi:hypothetical protein